MYMPPERKVFMDGRSYCVYPPSFYYANYTVHFAEPGWEQVLDRYEVSLVLWPSAEAAENTALADLLAALQASPHWKRIYEDHQATIFAHATRGRAWVDRFGPGDEAGG